MEGQPVVSFEKSFPLDFVMCDDAFMSFVHTLVLIVLFQR
jgi:hypothetical protein